jgi:hypothetical protein
LRDIYEEIKELIYKVECGAKKVEYEDSNYRIVVYSMCPKTPESAKYSIRIDIHHKERLEYT